MEITFSLRNRPISKAHIARLKESIKKHGYFSDLPILIDANGVIIDGQHRYVACTELGIDPEVLVVNGMTDAHIAHINNTQLKWKISDYVEYFAFGNTNYSLFKEQCLKHGIDYIVGLGILTGNTNAACIKNGKFIFNKVHVAQLDEFMAHLSLFKAYKFYKQWRFVRAFIRFLKIPNVSLAVLKDKIEKYPDVLTPSLGWAAYISKLVVLYNTHNRNNKIEFTLYDLKE